jgi:Dihaem cytochrome c
MTPFAKSGLAAACLIVMLALPPKLVDAASPGQKAAGTECTACHMFYLPGLLPQRSWSAIMADLPNHFGGDASLDDATRQQIEDYLVANAADAGGRQSGLLRGVSMDEVPLRITGMPWFKSVHGTRARDFAKNDPAIKTISNCTGCHRGAERGNFDDD